MNLVFWVLGLIGIIAADLFVVSHFSDVAESDPDRYFHLRLAQISSETAIPRTLPQVEDIGWGEAFLEKNFLFTWITGRAFHFGGEAAVAKLVPILSALYIAALYFLLTRFLPVLPSVALIFLALLSPDFANRLSLLRPHLLAFLTYTIFLTGLLTKRSAVAFLGGALFSLSYHATYLPLSALMLTILFAWKEKESWLRPAFFAGLGLGLGTIFNPYFPLNILSGANSFKIATNAVGLSMAERPLEVVPVRTDEFLSLFGPYILLFALSFYFGIRRKKDSSSHTSDTRYLILLVLGVLFWSMAAISRRAVEYAIPTTLVLMAITFSVLPSKKLQAGFLALALALSTLAAAPRGYRFYTHPLVAGVTPRYVMEALERVPAAEEGKKIFNCEWDNGSFIFYKRPQHRFVDLSDAILLVNHKPDLHRMRVRLRDGDVAFPYGLVRHAFKSDYVLCDNRSIASQLESDPFFKRIYPDAIPEESERVAGQTFLYKAIAEPEANFVKEWTVALGNKDSHAEEKLLEIPSPFPPSLYADLMRWSAFHHPEVFADGRSPVCAVLSVSEEEVKRLAGNEVMKWGGGESLRIWWNTTEIVNQNVSLRKPRILHNEFELPRKLQVGDKVRAEVCSPRGASYWGFSLSFWPKAKTPRQVPKYS
jgi:hypothetical protein